MSGLYAFDAVQALLTANWTATPVVYENEAQPPKAAQRNGILSPWVLCEVFGISDEQTTQGAPTKAANRWRSRGEILLHVCIAANTGSRVARVHADALMELFRATEGEGTLLKYGDMSVGSGGIGTEDGKWWRLTVTVDWTYN